MWVVFEDVSPPWALGMPGDNTAHCRKLAESRPLPCPAHPASGRDTGRKHHATPHSSVILRYRGANSSQLVLPLFWGNLPSQFSLKMGQGQEMTVVTQGSKSLLTPPLRDIMTRSSCPGWFLMLPSGGFSTGHLSSSSPDTSEPNVPARWDRPALQVVPFTVTHETSIQSEPKRSWNIQMFSKLT